MSKFVKKVGKVEYYEIDGIRAAGIIPYYIKQGQVYILINEEYRNGKLVNNIIGGKVDKVDKVIEDTMTREFNEETGFLISDILKILKGKNKFLNEKFFFETKISRTTQSIILEIRDNITTHLMSFGKQLEYSYRSYL